jgi:hypothetical protein
MLGEPIAGKRHQQQRRRHQAEVEHQPEGHRQSLVCCSELQRIQTVVDAEEIAKVPAEVGWIEEVDRRDGQTKRGPCRAPPTRYGSTRERARDRWRRAPRRARRCPTERQPRAKRYGSSVGISPESELAPRRTSGTPLAARPSSLFTRVVFAALWVALNGPPIHPRAAASCPLRLPFPKLSSCNPSASPYLSSSCSSSRYRRQVAESERVRSSFKRG